MLRVHLACAALLSLVLALPAQAQKDPKKPANLPLEADKFLKPGLLTGKLGAVNGSTFVLRLEFDRLELKPGARNQRNTNRQYTNLIREYDRLARAQSQLVRARTPQQQISAMRQIQQVSGQIQQTTLQLLGVGALQTSPFVVKKDFRDFDVEMATNVEVRTAFLPFAYDDMGDPKKYTKEEIKELKGPNPNVPGYKSDLSALKSGQKVQVTLAKVKEKVDAPAEKKDPEKKDPEKKDPEKKDAEKPDPEKKNAEKKDPEKVPVKVPEKDAEKKDPEKVPVKDPDKKDPEKVPVKVPEKDSAGKAPESKLQATRILILEESNDPVKPDRGKKNQ